MREWVITGLWTGQGNTAGMFGNTAGMGRMRQIRTPAQVSVPDPTTRQKDTNNGLSRTVTNGMPQRL